MTDRVDGARSRSILRFAVLGSLLVHALGIVLWGIAANRSAGLTALARPTPPPDFVVSISRATRIERRARPIPAPRPHPAAAQRVPPARAGVAAPAAQLPHVIPDHPSLEAPRVLHELAKEQPRIDVNPPRTMRATPSPPPAVPSARPQAAAPRVAFNRNGATSQAQAATRQLSQAQLAHIGQDLQKTLAELRREDDPLAVHATAPPAAPKRYHVQMLGADSDLKHGQGIYYPIKSWTADGYDYYYCAYQFVYADGLVEAGGVPWPVRFPPSHDPFLHPEVGTRGEAPLVGPLPGWKLPPGESIGKALLLAIPGLQSESR